MKKILICFIISILISGCTAGRGIDYRFEPVQADVINIDGYRVNVKIIKISDSIYDVMASPNTDDWNHSDLNNDFLSQYSRLREGAEIALKKQIGPDKKITMLDDIKPTSWIHMYIRFKVIEQ
jgi:hypothetical protein